MFTIEKIDYVTNTETTRVAITEEYRQELDQYLRSIADNADEIPEITEQMIANFFYSQYGEYDEQVAEYCKEHEMKVIVMTFHVKRYINPFYPVEEGANTIEIPLSVLIADYVNQGHAMQAPEIEYVDIEDTYVSFLDENNEGVDIGELK